MSQSIVALSSAAVLAIYSAGYLRTQAAADRFAAEAGQRRPTAPSPLAPPAARGSDVVAASRLDLASTDVGPAQPVVPDVQAADNESSRVDRPRLTPAPLAPPAATPATQVDLADKNEPADVAAPKVTVTPAQDRPIAPAPATVAGVATAAPVTATAMATAPATPDASAPAAAKYKDGTYTGWGTSRHGDIQAQVIVVDGRITSATIAQCMTRWPCSWIEALPPQVVQRQSPETDFVSGATQSTNAFYYGVVQALGKAALP